MTTDHPSHDVRSDEEHLRAAREVAGETESLNGEHWSPVRDVTIEGYELIRELHRGGQGIVCEALQKSTKRKVAIKVLSAGQYAPLATKRRFQREIELVAQLQHPHIISIFHSGVTSDGLPYYVMDYIRGMRLRDYVREKKLTLEATLDLFSAVCHGVQYAHQRGVVHRDLKPSNILVDVDGNPKILDFGLAKLLAGPTDVMVSVTQDVLGTLPYMSPEQAQGNPDEIDARIDVYSLGVILYELLTGHFPYPVVGHVADVLRHVAETPPTPPTRTWTPDSGITQRSAGRPRFGECPIDDEVETIVLRALAKERERRYQGAGDLAHDIDHYLQGEPIEARRDSLAYLLRVRSRGFAQRHRVTSYLGVIVLSILLTHWIAVPLVFRWTPVDRVFERFVTSAVPIPAPGPVFDAVRIVALTDDTDVEDLARREGLAGVTLQDIKSWRRLHGRLMKKLAESRCRTVVWDIMFRSETPFDDEFVEGVKTLRHAGAEVVVAVPTWELDDQGFPVLSKAIALSGVRWAWAIVRLAPLTVPFVAKRGLPSSQTSLILAAFASFKHPGAEFDILLDRPTESVDIRFWTVEAAARQGKRWVAVERIPVTTGRAGAEPDASEDKFRAKFNLAKENVLGFHRFDMPAHSVLSASTIACQEVFSASEEQLRKWFAGRLIVVGNFRAAAGDRHKLADGRIMSACYAQAAAIDALLRRVFVRVPTVTREWLLPLLGSVLGCLAGVIAPNRLRRYLGMTALTAVFLLASMTVYWRAQYLFDPLVPVVALLIAGELSSVVHRAVSGRRGSPSIGG